MTASRIGNPRPIESAHVREPRPHRRGPQAPGRRVPQALQSLSVGLSGLLDLLFPPRCPGCGVVSDTFCAACRATMQPRYDPRPLPSRRPVLAGLWSAGAYAGQLRTAIQRFKYRGRTDLARPLARLLADTWAAGRGAADVVVPVPQHPARTHRRGSTPATLLARALSTQVGLPCADQALARVRDTPPQVGLSARKRWLNVRDAFGPGPNSTLLQGQTVLLVDDVKTTGATLCASATACRAAGARRVVGLVVGHERA